MSEKEKNKEKYNIQVVSFTSANNDRNQDLFIFTELSPVQLRGIIVEKVRTGLKGGRIHIELFGKMIRIDDIVFTEPMMELRACKSLDAYKAKIMSQNDDCFNVQVLPIDQFLSSKLIDFEAYMRVSSEYQHVVNKHVAREPKLRMAAQTGAEINREMIEELLNTLHVDFDIPMQRN